MRWCREVLLDTIRTEGEPEIFNTDQGSQFTSPYFVKCLLDNEIKVLMDGKGRALDNVYIERFWRSLKHERSAAAVCLPEPSKRWCRSLQRRKSLREVLQR